MYKDTERQTPLFGVSANLSESARRRLEESWAHRFVREVYPVLLEIESEFSEAYGTTGRPNWSVARELGVCILQEMEGLTDQQAVDALCFDNRWRYALGFEASEDSYLSRQALVEFRSRIASHDPELEVLERVFDAVTDEALLRLGLSIANQRVDSTLIQSNIRFRARLDLLATTLRHALDVLRGQDEMVLNRVTKGLLSWYEQKEEGRGWFGDAAERTTLEQVGAWLLEIEQLFGDEAPYRDLEAIEHVRRVLREHFELDEPDPDPDGGGGKKINIQRRKHAHKSSYPTTLQSPFDPDAGMGHKGQGYMLHITETCSNKDLDGPKKPELITAFKLNPANQSDQNQAQELADKLQRVRRAPATLFADGGYVNATSLAETDARGLRLHGPVNRHGASGQALSRVDFDYDQDGAVVRCPEGHAPTDHRKRLYESDPEPVLHAFFDPETCGSCARYDDCPVRISNTYAFLPLVERLKLRDERFAEQKEIGWWEAYSIRSGVEATISELKRRHGCRRLRVRRRPRVKMALTFKLLGCNVKRWTRLAS